MARGGKRVGTAGRNYANRSDLQRGVRAPATPKVAPAGSQPFGAQADQIRSLAALPLATQSSSAPAADATTTGATPLIPQNVPALDRPTQRPFEPVTAGIATGPGPGPEVLPAAPPGPDTPVNAFISSLAANSSSPELAQLANYVSGGRG